MILVLCEEADASAIWAAGRLRDAGLAVQLVSGADLASAEAWEHRIGRDGAGFAVRLADGRVICGVEVRGVLNRLSFLPAAWLRRIGGPDRDYAVQELYAFCLSWLHALAGPKLNPPMPQGLCGNHRHPSAWMALASRAGLPVAAYRLSSRDDPAASWQPRVAADGATAIVVGERVIAPPELGVSLHDGCRRLAALAGTPLLGTDFAPDGEARAWRFAGASVMPNLIAGGEALIEALAEALTA